ncbi:MAG: hypothetical protein WCG25_06980 [bacterium]
MGKFIKSLTWIVLFGLDTQTHNLPLNRTKSLAQLRFQALLN